MIIKNTDKASTARAFYNSVVLRPTFINNVVFSSLCVIVGLKPNSSGGLVRLIPIQNKISLSFVGEENYQKLPNVNK